MKQLFAPWRHAWVTGAAAKDSGSHDHPGSAAAGHDGPGGGCLFCRVWADPSRDAENLLVFRGRRVLVMLNRYPYNGGHLLVAPVDHRGALEALDAEVRAEMMELAARAADVLGALYRPDGYNIGINQGRAAGAGIPDHVHLHVVPRWNGDTNFITTVGEARVISQDLGLARTEIAGGFARPAAGSGDGP